jgi:phage terminase large subunit-like protein
MREMAQALEFALLKHDRGEFARTLGVEPDPWQEELLRSESSRILLNCSRQSGKSTMSAIIALHRAIYYPGSLILCLAPALRQSQELFQKLSVFYQELGKPIAPVEDRKLSMALENGSRIVTLPGDEKTIRGFSGVSLLLVDEAARVNDGLYFAIRPMLAVSGGTLMMLSTPYGKRGVFYEAWTGEDVGEGWERYKVTAEDVPRISPEFLADERASLPDRVYAQEYEVAFVETDEQVFSEAVIAGITTDDFEPLDI